MKKQRIFNGKKYEYFGTFDNKKVAKVYSKELREFGKYFVRLIRGSKGEWHVYAKRRK